MAHRTSKGGTLRIDKHYAGVGRIALASGATTKEGFKKRLAMLDGLYDKGRLDVLRAIKEGAVNVTESLDAYRRDALDELTGPGKVLLQNLWETIEGWSPRARKKRPAPKPKTVGRYKSAFKALKTKGPLGDHATVGDLGRVNWGRLEQEWGMSAADWNHLRRAVSRFLSDVLGGIHHPLWRRLMEQEFPIRAEKERVTDITPDVFWRIMDARPGARQSFICCHYAIGVGHRGVPQAHQGGPAPWPSCRPRLGG